MDHPHAAASTAVEAPAEPVRPDYGGAWVGAVLPALSEAVEATRAPAGGNRELPAWLPEVVCGARHALLLVIDGMGWNVLAEHRELVPTMAAMQGRAITTVAPSTTSAGLTSIATGAAPGQHGLLGYRIRVGGQVLNVLSWSNGSRTPPSPEDTQPLTPFAGRPIPVVSRGEFVESGFTRAHLRGGVFTGWRTTSTLVEHCLRSLAADEPLTYAYYDGPDKVAHEYGLDTGFYAAELGAVDRLVDQLLDAASDDTVLVITADHGQVQVGPDGAVTLEPIAGLVSAMAGEGRFRSLWARPGASGELLAAAVEHHSHQGWVFTREQLFDEGWVAPAAGGSPLVRSRLGDVVLAARAPVMFVDPAQGRERLMQSQHGSLTAAEMLVPLLAARGRR